MSDVFFCWYCLFDKPKAGRKILRWRTGKAAGKVRGYKCADCASKAITINQEIKSNGQV